MPSWPRVALYGVLAEVMPSPVVELNRAVAISMAYGPQAGLELVDQFTAEPSLRNYHLLPSVRGDLLRKLGRQTGARAEFARAATLTTNERERQLSAARARDPQP
jgi:predicted RNA polymerase sigma factor